MFSPFKYVRMKRTWNLPLARSFASFTGRLIVLVFLVSFAANIKQLNLSDPLVLKFRTKVVLYFGGSRVHQNKLPQQILAYIRGKSICEIILFIN